MSLFKEVIIAELLKEQSENDIVRFKGFRQAKRESLKMMDDIDSDVFGASFALSDGTFLKEIHL